MIINKSLSGIDKDTLYEHSKYLDYLLRYMPETYKSEALLSLLEDMPDPSEIIVGFGNGALFLRWYIRQNPLGGFGVQSWDVHSFEVVVHKNGSFICGWYDTDLRETECTPSSWHMRTEVILDYGRDSDQYIFEELRPTTDLKRVIEDMVLESQGFGL